MLNELYQLYSLLLFIPGITLLEILNQRYKWRIPLLERLIAGALIWNFVFASVSSMLGFFPHLLINAYRIFGYLSIFLIIVCLFFKFKVLKNRQIHLNLRNSPTPILVYLLPIFLVISIITLFTRIWAGWDVWAWWLPMAKAIAERSDLLFHTFFLSKEAMAVTPPYIPLLYAWTYSITEGDYYRLIPVIYYILFGIMNFLFSKALFASRKVALGATVVSMTSLITFATLFANALHPDLPTAFFICSAMVFLAKILKGETETRNALLLGISLSLLMLTQVVGLFVTYALMTVVSLSMRVPYRKALFTPFFLFPSFFLLLNARHLDFLPLLLFYSILLAIIVKRNVFRAELKIKKALAVFIPLLLPITYLFAMGQYSGIWAYGAIVPAYYNQAYMSLARLRERAMQTTGVQETLLDVFRLDDIFLRYTFIIYIPLIPFGLVSSFRREKPERGFLYIITIMFLIIFLLHPRMFYPTLAPDLGYVRRYTYFLPLIAVFASKGFFWLLQLWTSAKIRKIMFSTSLTSFIIYNTFSMLFILERVKDRWPYPLSSIFAISELRASVALSYATVLDLVVLAAILFISLELSTLLDILGRVQIVIRRQKNRKRMGSVFLLSIICISSFSIVYALRQPLTDISIYGVTTRYAPPDHVEELVDFFKGVKDDGVIIGFTIYYLITFADRRVIDLSTTDGFRTFSDLFQNISLSGLTIRLTGQNVKYIIEPTNIETAEYKIFSEYRREFPLLSDLLKSNRVMLLESYTNYNVYKILSPSEHEEYLQKLNYYFYLENAPKIISDDNQSKLYQSAIQNVSLTDTREFKVKGENAMRIEISPYIQQAGGISYKFKVSYNLTDKDVISFYWYGSSSGYPISIRFQTGNWRNQYKFSFTDSWNGWARLIIPLNHFKVEVGSPSWDNVTLIAFVFEKEIKSQIVFYVDRVTADIGIMDYYLIPLESLKP